MPKFITVTYIYEGSCRKAIVNTRDIMTVAPHKDVGCSMVGVNGATHHIAESFEEMESKLVGT